MSDRQSARSESARIDAFIRHAWPSRAARRASRRHPRTTRSYHWPRNWPREDRSMFERAWRSRDALLVRLGREDDISPHRFDWYD